MAQLRDFELANLALWCLDFEKAAALYHSMIRQSGGKLDIVGTLGVVENAMLSNELGNEVWWAPKAKRQLDLKFDQETSTLTAGYEAENEDRAKRLKSIITSREKEILKTIQHHKKQLKDIEADSTNRQMGGGAPRRPRKLVSETWFMVVECFAWFVSVARIEEMVAFQNFPF